MVFSSIVFLFYFLPITLLLYFMAPPKGRNFILFGVSLVFYGWGEPIYILLMLFSIFCNFMLGLLLEASTEKTEHKNKRKQILILAVLFNIGLLVFFKYTDFVINSVSLWLDLGLTPLKLPLPLGISFYTFQALSYVIDLYRGQVKVQRSFIDFGTYVALFPQLIAGPIVRMKTIESELLHREESVALFSKGVRRFLIGLSKKVLLANNAGLIFTAIINYPAEELSVITAWLGILAFTFQIYFDFSGYSDMAIGLGYLLGFHFPENFRYPYTARSITDFWRRWHMSLSTWFKEYVYIPLGGNRGGSGKQIRNILITWMLTGLWHGASWNFFFWGLYFGILLIVEKQVLSAYLDKLPRFFQRAYTLFFVVISWVIFAFDDLGQGLGFLQAMFLPQDGGICNGQTLYLLSGNLVFFLILGIGATPVPGSFARAILGKLRSLSALGKGGGSWGGRAADALELLGFSMLFLGSLASLVASSYNPFLYFRF